MTRLAAITAVVLCGCDPGNSAQGLSAARIAIEFVRSYADRTLSVDAATRLLAATGAAQQTNEYWQVKTTDGTIEIVIKARTPREATEDAELHLPVEAGVSLKDLEAAFGRWELVSASESSSVAFQIEGVNRSANLAFARLLTPRPDPESPVMSIQMRRRGP